MKRIIILLSILFLLPVYTQAEIKQTGRTTLSKGLTPYVPEITTDHAPKVRKLAKQLLALIDSMHAEEDFSVQRIQKNSGIRLNEYPDHPNRAYLGKRLNKQWGFLMTLINLPDNSPSFMINISPDSTLTHEHFPVATDICIDLGQFHQQLLRIGYQNINSSAGSSQYRRNNVYLDINFIGESKNRIRHDCLSALDLSLSNLGKK